MGRTVTAVCERDESGMWTAHLAEEPRCHTWGRSLQAARMAVREAADLWTDELGVADVSELTFVDEVRGIEGAADASVLARLRVELTEHLELVRRESEALAPKLMALGLSVRDVAGLLGVSPGRVSQIAPTKDEVIRTRVDKVVKVSKGRKVAKAAQVVKVVKAPEPRKRVVAPDPVPRQGTKRVVPVAEPAARVKK